MTLTERQRKTKDQNLPPETERYLRACSDIASALVQEHEAQQDPTKPKKDVNLNSLRSKMSKKHKLSNIPPLTAIIAAIPEHYKKYILPKLIAKPISMLLCRTQEVYSYCSQEVHQELQLWRSCANLTVVLILHTPEIYVSTVLAVQIPTSNTLPNLTPATNLRRCELFEHVMIPSNRQEAEWTKSSLWDIAWTKSNTS
jgi:hypothetical protein